MLADPLGRPGDVEHVVEELERQPDPAAEARQPVRRRRRRPARPARTPPRTASRSSARSGAGSARRVTAASQASARWTQLALRRAPTTPATAPAPGRPTRCRPARRTPARRAGRRPRSPSRRPAAATTVGRPRRSAAASSTSSWTSDAEWMSSTAAAARTTGSSGASGPAASRTSSGRSRLPPAAIVADACSPSTGAVRRGDRRAAAPPPAPAGAGRAGRRRRRSARRRDRRPERSPQRTVPWCRAMIPPAVSTQPTSASPTSSASTAPRPARVREALHRGGQVRVGVRVAGDACRSPGRSRSNHSEKNVDSGGLVGVVISRTTTRPPGRTTRAISDSPSVEVAEVPRAEADGRRGERVVLVGQRLRVAALEAQRRRLLARALEHRLGEVHADDLAAGPTREAAPPPGRRCRSPRRARGRPGRPARGRPPASASGGAGRRS